MQVGVGMSANLPRCGRYALLSAMPGQDPRPATLLFLKCRAGRLDSLLSSSLVRTRACRAGSTVFPFAGNRRSACRLRDRLALISDALILDLFRIGCAVSFGDSMSNFVGDPVGDAQKSGEKP